MIARRLLVRMALATAVLNALPALAQEWPARPVTLVTPYSAGGGLDIFARALAHALSLRWKQSVVVENRTGGTEVVAAMSVVSAKPDGYTLFVSSDTGLESNPFLFTKLPYNPLTDFTPIVRLVEAPYLYVVKADGPHRSMQQMLQTAKSQPGKLSYGSTGPGGGPHIAINWLSHVTGAPFLHVPYRGSAPAIQDLLGGTIDFTAGAPAPFLPFVKENKMRAIAVSSATRSRLLPDVPTLVELGYADLLNTFMFGLVGPPKMAAELANKIANDVVVVMRDPEFVARHVDAQGYTVAAETTPQAFARYLASNQEKIKARVVAANVKLD